MFDPVSNKLDFPAMEREVLRFWDKRKVFRASLGQRRQGKEYVFYDGPPFATGLPHYGHLLAGTIKDIVPRYHSMRGRYVDRRFGWDCHGLPVEYEMEQELGISGKREIEALGVDVFNEKCRGIVLRHTQEWRRVVTRMGRWVDFDRDYKTMETPYMESIWWVFQTLWNKDLIYRGDKILPYCPRCATPLSNFETNQGYADVQDPAITVRFAVRGEPRTWLLAWTTTPWTLPSNLLLAVGADIPYVTVQDGEDRYILARARLDAYYRDPSGYRILREMTGRELAGLEYEPLFDDFSRLRAEGAFRVTPADFVSTEEGTGIVHAAPGFGEDDYHVGRALGLPALCPVDDEGRFTPEVSTYAGRLVKECDADIIRLLKDEGRLVHRGVIQHSYPHCWRCDSALIYRAVSTWFVRVEALKERMIECNRQVHWVPGHLRDGRFGKWLEGARDWAISRNRYWGTPLPVWSSEDGTETVCVGSVAELERLSGQRVTDLHKHFVDALEIPAPSGRGVLRRVPEVLDCWFESGAMPYAQSHYPFENRAHFEAHFPADFIAEGLDQTRGWFYTLMVLSTALFDRPAFRNVVVNGLILAADGRKMSKRLKNYPDPAQLIDTYGADALRLYMIHSPVVRAEDLCFTEDGVKEALRHVLIPWWNAFSFFVTYARVDGWTPAAGDAPPPAGRPLLDRWILSALDGLISEVSAAMEGYDLQRAVRPFVGFTEHLTNWYIRRSRRRVWKSDNDADKLCAYATLYHVLLELSKVAAPFVPFISEAVYRHLRLPAMPESVHLCDFPEPDGARDAALEERMAAAIAVVGCGRRLRAEHNLKVRQPLAMVHVICRNTGRLEQLRPLESLLAEELNVKQVHFSSHESDLVTLRIKPNFRALGPRLGPAVKTLAPLLAGLSQEAIEKLLGGEALTLTVDGKDLALEAGDVQVERAPREGLVVATEGEWVVGLDTALDEALVSEGLARELVNRIQSMRKGLGLEVSQRIRLFMDGDEPLLAAAHAHSEYIRSEVLAAAFTVGDRTTEEAERLEIEGHACRIRISLPGD